MMRLMREWPVPPTRCLLHAIDALATEVASDVRPW